MEDDGGGWRGCKVDEDGGWKMVEGSGRQWRRAYIYQAGSDQFRVRLAYILMANVCKDYAQF